MNKSNPSLTGEAGGCAVAILIGLALLFFCCGCGQQTTLEDRAANNERAITILKKGAEKIRKDTQASRKELVEQGKTIAEQVAKCDEVIGKIDALLGNKPEPVVPDVVIPPKPSNPDTKPLVPTPDPPVPKPKPPQPVDPEPADGRFAIAKAVYRIAIKVESPDRANETEQLASVFKSVAVQVQAGTLNGSIVNPQWRKISSALTAGNKPILSKHMSAWKSAAGLLGEAIETNYSDGKLDTNQDWADLLNEIGTGLDAAAKSVGQLG